MRNRALENVYNRIRREIRRGKRMGSAYRVLDRRAKKGFLLRWTFVLCSVSFALLVQSDSSNAKVGDMLINLVFKFLKDQFIFTKVP